MATMTTEVLVINEPDEKQDDAQERVRQLSFDVGGKRPDGSAVKATIDVPIERELKKGSDVMIGVATADGEVLAQMHARVVSVTFEDEYKDGYIVGTERVHKVKAV